MKKLIPIIFILILGTCLRFYQLGEKSLWLDEACSLYQAEKSLPLLLKDTAKNDAHPPLYNTLLHTWINFHPGRHHSEAKARSLSVIISILTIILVYRTGQLFFGNTAGLWAALITAVSSYQVFYAQEARLQALLVLLTISSIYFFYRSITERKNHLWLGFIISTTLSLYTFLYSFFIILGNNLFFISRFRKYRPALKMLILAQLIIFILFSPWIPVLIQRMALVQSVTNVFLLSSFKIIHTLFFDFTFGYTKLTGPEWVTALVLFIFFSLTIYGITEPARRRDTAILSSIWLILPLLLVILLPWKIHIFQSKHLILSSPAYYLLLSNGLAKLKSRKIAKAFLTLFILLNLISLSFYYRENFVKEDWRGTVEYTEDKAGGDDLVLFNPPYSGFAFDYYYTGNLTRAGVSENNTVHMRPNQLSINHKRIWLVQNYSPVSHPSALVRDWLEKEYKIEDKKEFPGSNGKIVVSYYRHKLSPDHGQPQGYKDLILKLVDKP